MTFLILGMGIVAFLIPISLIVPSLFNSNKKDFEPIKEEKDDAMQH